MENMGKKILQWNIRGLRKNITDLTNLLNTEIPLAMCIQETKLNQSVPLDHIGQYKFYRKDTIPTNISYGGVAIAVRNDTPTAHLPLQTNLQAVAVMLQLPCHTKITVCSLYLDPHSFSSASLVHLCDQLPEPTLLLGDFNGRHTMWG